MPPNRRDAKHHNGRIERHNERIESVLVLTDGNSQAERIAEWGLAFANVSMEEIHRIDVIDCLDSGVIIHRDEMNAQNEEDKEQEMRDEREHGQTERRFTDRPDAYETHKSQSEPVIDVLHGVPHEAILEYITTNAIDLVIICVCKRIRPKRSFLGEALTRVTRTTTLPTITIEYEKNTRETCDSPNSHDPYETPGGLVRLVPDGGAQGQQTNTSY